MMDSTELTMPPKSIENDNIECSSSELVAGDNLDNVESIKDSENDQNLVNIASQVVSNTDTGPIKPIDMPPKSQYIATEVVSNVDTGLIKPLDMPPKNDERQNSLENSVVVDNFSNVEHENSDSETEKELTFSRSTKRGKIQAILDSDSENEELQKNVNPVTNTKEFMSDSDSETDEKLIKTPRIKSRKIAIIDSDSDNEITSFEDFVAKKNQNKNTDDETEKEASDIFVFNNRGDLIAEGEESSGNQKKILSNLCDGESSDADSGNEDRNEGISEDELNSLQVNEPLKSRKRKSAKSTKEENPEKMTAKKALEQRKEILAESQRRVRESRVSLPYHKPKARSLKEFLQNRPKLASPLCNIPQGQSPVAAIKMSMEQLELVSQKLKEREKEVEKFYESESESEDEAKTNGAEIQSGSPNPGIIQDIQTETNEVVRTEENLEITGTTKETMEGVIESASEPENVKNSGTDERSEAVNEIIQSDSEKSDQVKESDSEEQKDSGEINENIPPEIVEKDDTISQVDLQPIEADVNKPEKPLIISNILLTTPETGKAENIHNLEEETKEVVREETKRVSNSYEFNLDDIEDECENGLDDTQMKRQKKLEILQKFIPFQPKLSGGPDQVIDLVNGVTFPDEVTKLRERFFQHNSKTGKHKHKKEISIMSVNDGKIEKETLSVNMDEEDDENTAPIEKPGVRFQKLRVELQHQMAQRRSDLWKEKLNQKTNEDQVEEENLDEKIQDDEEEEEMTESEEDDADLEEDDCDMSEKKRKKSAFVDEEAEESDMEDDTEAAMNIEDEDKNEENVDAEKELDEDSDQNENEENNEEEIPKKKVLKRIIKPFDDEDDDSDDASEGNKSFGLVYQKKQEKFDTFEDFFPPHQPSNYKTGGIVITPTKSETDFCTPVTYMTGIQNLNKSGTKTTPLKIPLENEESFTGNLFPEEFDTKSQEEPLTSTIEENVTKSQVATENCISTQDVLDICSGNFSSSSKMSSPEISTQQLAAIFENNEGDDLSNAFKTQDLANICSGQFTGTTQAKQSENILDENDEQIISQLIDEEELERFKKKFESPLDSNSQKINFEEAKETEGGGVIDSDDEHAELTLKRKKRKRLTFSDDEDSEDSNLSVEETIDLQDNEGGDSDVEYDSEENEIETDEKITKDEKIREMVKANEFFENEAELSESEWGSEDEDERNLDDMEFEKGDEEKFDDDELRTDIERIQMRQMLDDDNREVKLLQELLLEDGELHGSGRQRQFRWKNIDDAGQDGDNANEEDGAVYLEEEESEEQWRKMRHEREMFMMKKQSQVADDTLIIETGNLSFTKKSLKIKSQTSVTSQNTTPKEIAASPKIQQPFSLSNKRGSFLSRSEQILQKFAETTKLPPTKNFNRIVFQSVDDKKRKATSTPSDSTPKALKKIRLSEFSPALKEKSSKKSLFG